VPARKKGNHEGCPYKDSHASLSEARARKEMKVRQRA
jgi:hypothetical protein